MSQYGLINGSHTISDIPSNSYLLKHIIHLLSLHISAVIVARIDGEGIRAGAACHVVQTEGLLIGGRFSYDREGVGAIGAD